jgi:putative flippase GtrA
MDFAFVALLVSGLKVSPPLATLFGCILGGIVNFSINRSWAFTSTGPVSRMMRRYVLVSSASALWNAGLVAAMLLIPRMPYQVAWWLTRGIVYFGWNYPMHKRYVFSHRGSA